MIPEGYTRVYPVYRFHLAEVEALAGLVERLYEKRRETGPADDRYFFLSIFRERLGGLAEALRASGDPVAYVDRADRDLLAKISGFLQENPEIMAAEKTA